MSLYDKHVLPKLVHFACSQQPAMRQRQKIVPLAKGRVLEVGLGSGLNLPYYDASKVSKVWGLDPSPEMIQIAETRARSVNFDVEFIDLPGEHIPLETNSVDTVVVTYTLCTIVDVDRAIKEMLRVLRPDGELVFCEHGIAPDVSVRRLQKCINPLWKRIGGGCHLNREIPKLIEQNGFRIKEMEAMYISGWRPASYNYWGTAISGVL
ncbi:MAG: class I SAM-dependent methyltransferase [Desulfuromonadales bacterium]|nr:class I SAM-dependent methyltransferase [Desulfuromonadales bacterium]